MPGKRNAVSDGVLHMTATTALAACSAAVTSGGASACTRHSAVLCDSAIVGNYWQCWHKCESAPQKQATGVAHMLPQQEVCALHVLCMIVVLKLGRVHTKAFALLLAFSNSKEAMHEVAQCCIPVWHFV